MTPPASEDCWLRASAWGWCDPRSVPGFDQGCGSSRTAIGRNPWRVGRYRDGEGALRSRVEPHCRCQALGSDGEGPSVDCFARVSDISWTLCRGVRSSWSRRLPTGFSHLMKMIRLASDSMSTGSATSALLTVFAKTRPNERREVDRAKRALQRCMTEHGLTGDQDD